VSLPAGKNDISTAVTRFGGWFLGLAPGIQAERTGAKLRNKQRPAKD
jgi:hypothetical protein